jgi:hypothetical protein
VGSVSDLHLDKTDIIRLQSLALPVLYRLR